MKETQTLYICPRCNESRNIWSTELYRATKDKWMISNYCGGCKRYFDNVFTCDEGRYSLEETLLN